MTRGGEDEFKTNIGAFFSLLMILSVFAFSAFRLVTLVHKQDADLTITDLADFFDDDYIFEGGDDLRYAAYVSDMNGFAVDVSSYGELFIAVDGWDSET